MNEKKNGKLPKWAIFVIIGLSLLIALLLFLVFVYPLSSEFYLK